jgi:hypothetical protein
LSVDVTMEIEGLRVPLEDRFRRLWSDLHLLGDRRPRIAAPSVAAAR